MSQKAVLITLFVLGAMILAGCQEIAPIGNDTSNDTFEPLDNNFTNSITGQVPADQESIPSSTEALPLTGVVIEGTAGELVQLNPQAIDPDDDVVSYFYSKPFDAKGRWQTSESDAGRYAVTVTASDGKANTSEEITVLIKQAKKAPVIECPGDVNVKEGDLINLNCNIYDPEGDQAIVEYSGFMKGPTYQTTFSDAGTYTTIIKAKNQYKEASKTVKITIINTNRAPLISLSGSGDIITATEGDIVALSPSVSDPDGDKVTITYSEPFDSAGTWKTKIGDTGTRLASIVASDGSTTAKKEITLKILMKNTAPNLKNIADITVSEGDAIKLPIDVTDREGDKVKITVSGWLNSETYTTTYDDAGVYSVTVTASDGQYQATQTFKVTVVNKNRPPVFKVPA